MWAQMTIISMRFTYKIRRIVAQFMISVVGRALLVNVQIGDTFKIFDVAGNKGQVVLDGGCGDEDIQIANNISSAA